MLPLKLSLLSKLASTHCYRLSQSPPVFTFAKLNFQFKDDGLSQNTHLSSWELPESSKKKEK